MGGGRGGKGFGAPWIALHKKHSACLVGLTLVRGGKKRKGRKKELEERKNQGIPFRAQFIKGG